MCPAFASGLSTGSLVAFRAGRSGKGVGRFDIPQD